MTITIPLEQCVEVKEIDNEVHRLTDIVWARLLVSGGSTEK